MLLNIQLCDPITKLELISKIDEFSQFTIIYCISLFKLS